jgi:hypothetical protein
VRINANHTLTFDASAAVWDLDKGEKAVVKLRYTVSDGDEASTALVKITVDGVSPDIAGNANGNRLNGTKGSDVIDGRGGADRIDGKTGDDVLVGGNGADTFRFATGCGKDKVIDFEFSTEQHDRLDLRGLKSIEDFADLVANHMKDQGSDVLIDAGKGDTILLKNVEIADLGEQHFRPRHPDAAEDHRAADRLQQRHRLALQHPGKARRGDGFEEDHQRREHGRQPAERHRQQALSAGMADQRQRQQHAPALAGFRQDIALDDERRDDAGSRW